MWPLIKQIRSGHGVGARVVVLPEDLDRGLFVVGANPVLRLGQHTAGAAGRIADGDDDTGLGEHAGVGFQQQVDHEQDDFARGEVIAGRFVGGFVEAADQVLEHQPHGDVVDFARVQVDLGELSDHLVEAIGLFGFFSRPIVPIVSGRCKLTGGEAYRKIADLPQVTSPVGR